MEIPYTEVILYMSCPVSTECMYLPLVVEAGAIASRSRCGKGPCTDKALTAVTAHELSGETRWLRHDRSYEQPAFKRFHLS